MKLVDLTKKPYNLGSEDIKWVETTIANMSLEEKIGQLFVNMGSSRDEEYLKECVEKYHIGGVRYNPGVSKDIHLQNVTLQKYSKIPLLIASNVEGGGNGACVDGTEVGMPVKIGATDDTKYAYEMGRISGIEGNAIGSNWSFAPLVDINYNWRNPIVASRCFANDPQKVAAHAKAYFDGITESNFACAMKHFPGDGVDERDQHVSNSVNTFSTEEWDASFGHVYKTLIDSGIQSVMIGHIMLPSYSKHFNPNLTDAEILPATLSKEITNDLLKEHLGFNGLVVTDASHMVGLTCHLKRSEMLPATIAAGCDMFLFFNDMDEDFNYMLEGYKSGIITEERLNDALTRILGTKAALGLHKCTKEELVPSIDNLSVVNCEAHKAIANEVSDQAITLVKNLQADNLPLNPNKTKRLLIVYATALSGNSIFNLMGGNKVSPAEVLKEKLVNEGFEVSIYESPLVKLQKLPKEQQFGGFMAYMAGKTPISDWVGSYDAIITLTNVNGMGQTVERVSWGFTKGGGEIPWYVHEMPVIVISLKSPFVLADVPQAKTYINCYDAQPNTIDQLVEKLLGRSEFKGVDNVNAFTDRFDTRF